MKLPTGIYRFTPPRLTKFNYSHLATCLLAGSLSILPLLTSCQDDYDDTALWDAVNNHEERLAALEQWQEETNHNIAAIQQLLNTTDCITAITPLMEGGQEVGYTITFLHSDPITIYHGKKGDKGDKGEQGDTGDKGEQGDKGDTGADGHTPQIGLTQKEDGNWYWTLDGQLMTDPQGNPIRANGEDGKDGQDGTDGEDGQDGTPGADGKPGQDGDDGTPAPTPQISLGSSITEGTIATDNGTKKPDAWYLSVDGGQTWYRISGEDGEDGDRGPTGPQGPTGQTGPEGATGKPGDSMFADPPITDEGTHYTFHLADNNGDDQPDGTFQIPIYQSLKIGDGTGIITLTGTTQEITLTYPTETTAADYTALVAQITPEGADGTYTDISTRADNVSGWSVKGDLENNKVTVTAPGGSAMLRVTLIGTDGSEVTASCVVTLPYTVDESGAYTVYTADGLLAWAKAAQEASSTNCTLAADITLPDPAEAGGSNWTPVGTSNNSYTGTFNGAEHTISNLQITSPYSNIGLFGYVGEDGTIENCHVEGSISSTSSRAGGIAGRSDGSIQACSFSATVSGTDYAGGIAGRSSEGSIQACSSSATVIGTNYAGGIAGCSDGGSIQACFSSATVNGSNSAGGIVGLLNDSGTMLSCYATGKVTGTHYVGAIAGRNNGRSTITACYWSGDATTGVCWEDEGITSDVGKVDDSTITWTTATTGMNTAITTWNASHDNACPYHYEQKDGENEPPVLKDGAPQ